MHLSKNSKLWLGAVVFLVVNWGIYSFLPESGSSKISFHLASAVSVLLLLVLLWIAQKKNFDPVKCFVPVALVTGLLYMTSVPAFRGADEELHFYRAYEISCGHLASDCRDGAGGRELPVSLWDAKPDNFKNFDFEQMGEKLKISLKPEEKEFIAFNTSALYSPVQYLPQASGILIGRLFHLPPVALVYCGRAGNLLFWILACWLALRISKGSSLIYLIGLLPSMLHAASILSGDAVTVGCILLFVTYLIKLSYFEREKRITGHHLTILFLLGMAISLCKIVYFPICLLIFVLPQSKFRNRKRYLTATIFLVVVCILANLSWTAFSWRFLNEVNEGVNAAEQVKYILFHPVRYLGILLRTTANYFNFYLQTVVGANFCLFDTPIYIWITDCYLVLLGYLAVFHNPIEAQGYFVQKKDKGIALLALTAVFLLINTSLYVQWTPVGKAMIDGIQGRYFAPFLCLLPFFFRKRSEYRAETVTVCASILLAYPVVMTLFLKHI